MTSNAISSINATITFLEGHPDLAKKHLQPLLETLTDIKQLSINTARQTSMFSWSRDMDNIENIVRLINVLINHSHQPKMRIIDIRHRRLVRFRKLHGVLFGEEMVSFAWNKVKKRTFTVDIITTGIVVDFPVPQMPQNWQTKAYFDVFLFRWMKRTISSMKTNYIESTVGTKRTLLWSVSTIYKKNRS